MMTAKSENSRNSRGSSAIPAPMSALLKIPFLPRKGIHEIIRIMFDVQNGTVHNSNSAICQIRLCTWKAKK